MNSRRLHELMDSCRPGHADVAEPEFNELARELSQDPSLQRLFERSQALDEDIRTAFQAVTPPPGLAQRLLAAIEPMAPETMTPETVTPETVTPETVTPETVTPETVTPETVTPETVTPETVTPETVTSEADERSVVVPEPAPTVELASHSSRRVFRISAGIASLAAVAAVITLWLQWPQTISLPSSDRDIAELVERWNVELDNTNWLGPESLPAEEFPTWQHLDLSLVARWQWIAEHRIVCYDFEVKGGTVRLFVIKPTDPVELASSPPLGYPLPSGWQVGAWQANGRVYYLAVSADGDSKGLYSRVITSPSAAA